MTTQISALGILGLPPQLSSPGRILEFSRPALPPVLTGTANPDYFLKSGLPLPTSAESLTSYITEIQQTSGENPIHFLLEKLSLRFLSFMTEEDLLTPRLTLLPGLCVLTRFPPPFSDAIFSSSPIPSMYWVPSHQHLSKAKFLQSYEK